MPATFVKMAGKNSQMIRLESGQLHKCRQCTFDSDESQCTQGIDYHDWSLSFEYWQVQQAFGDNDLFTHPFEQQCFSHLCVNLDIVFYGISNHCFFMVFSNHVFFMVFLKCVKICIFVLKFVERENIIAKSVAKTVLY